MRIGPHHHPCARCGTRTECCGDIEQNYDGWPEWTCREYHQSDGQIGEFMCETCAAWCEYRGQRFSIDLGGGTDSDAGNDVPGGGAA